MPDYDFSSEVEHAASLLDRVERTLASARSHFVTMQAAAEVAQIDRSVGEYMRSAENLKQLLKDIQRTFSDHGPLAARVSAIKQQATALLTQILESAGLAPDEPGLSQRVEVKKAAVLGRSQASSIKKVLEPLKLAKGKLAAGADLALVLAILLEVGTIFVKQGRKKR